MKYLVRFSINSPSAVDSKQGFSLFKVIKESLGRGEDVELSFAMMRHVEKGFLMGFIYNVLLNFPEEILSRVTFSDKSHLENGREINMENALSSFKEEGRKSAICLMNA